MAHRASTFAKDACDPDVLSQSTDMDLKLVGDELLLSYSVITKLTKAEVEYALQKKPVKRAKTRFLMFVLQQGAFSRFRQTYSRSHRKKK